ncbi:MAG: hypothetical protein SFU86_15605 [Pirellulaceae bacterium]|nr:hypothetical protein [Pirellulaceae bacterium]
MMGTLERAIEIAVQAHCGQVDKEGQPYILHPLRVMQAVEGTEAKIVGVLHDVVEDTAVTLADLAAAGFSEPILAAVALVTHNKATPYAEYVIRCQANPLALAVKLADLTDNTRPDRVLFRADRIERDLARIRRYLLSYKFLTGHITEVDYRRLMGMEELP